MPGLQQPPRHVRAHAADADESIVRCLHFVLQSKSRSVAKLISIGDAVRIVKKELPQPDVVEQVFAEARGRARRAARASRRSRLALNAMWSTGPVPARFRRDRECRPSSSTRRRSATPRCGCRACRPSRANSRGSRASAGTLRACRARRSRTPWSSRCRRRARGSAPFAAAASLGVPGIAVFCRRYRCRGGSLHDPPTGARGVGASPVAPCLPRPPACDTMRPIHALPRLYGPDHRRFVGHRRGARAPLRRRGHASRPDGAPARKARRGRRESSAAAWRRADLRVRRDAATARSRKSSRRCSARARSSTSSSRTRVSESRAPCSGSRSRTIAANSRRTYSECSHDLRGAACAIAPRRSARDHRQRSGPCAAGGRVRIRHEQVRRPCARGVAARRARARGHCGHVDLARIRRFGHPTHRQSRRRPRARAGFGSSVATRADRPRRARDLRRDLSPRARARRHRARQAHCLSLSPRAMAHSLGAAQRRESAARAGRSLELPRRHASAVRQRRRGSIGRRTSA